MKFFFFIFVTFSYSDRFIIYFIFFFFSLEIQRIFFMTCNNIVNVMYTSNTIQIYFKIYIPWCLISFLASCLLLNKNHIWPVHLWITWFRWEAYGMNIKDSVICKFYWTKRNFYCVPYSALTMYTHPVNFWRYICFILYTSRGRLIWGVKAYHDTRFRAWSKRRTKIKLNAVSTSGKINSKILFYYKRLKKI